MEKEIENFIEENLCGDDCDVALKFVAFLRANNYEFIKGDGYWKDKIYYSVKLDGHDCVCFISIKGSDEIYDRWTVWSDDIDSALLDSSLVDDELREIALNHVDYCGKCGSCGGGRKKVIFGREYNNICGCTFRFDNPSEDDLRFLKKMIEIH